jgi:redox-sensitive bicupin YhaK (pirin superfamily)
MSNVILRNEALTAPWAGTDPFLFCARHVDHFPASDGAQGVPASALGARPMGNDFSHEGGFNMYYGETVPGFPAHPHRGFETVTIVPTGLVDHADSLGATARYGDGDVQWLTAGRGVMHAEMFPLRSAEEGNLLDLYQLWLNLPARSKMAEPAFVMLWDGTIPHYRTTTAEGATATVKVIAGAYKAQEGQAETFTPPAPPPDSWASNPDADLAIWQITLEPGARLTLPAAVAAGARRTLYFHRGERLEIAGDLIEGARRIEVVATETLALANVGQTVADIMLLQAVPIGEPVVARGPFVMNSEAEIDQARRDFGHTRFGGWPWGVAGPVHENGRGRFAIHPGTTEPDLPPG